jgi:transcriptional regulator with XRE-family HTH domain
MRGMDARFYDSTRLVRLREKKGKTQEQVAEELDVTQMTICRVETGKGVSFELLYRLARYYSVPYKSLLREPPPAEGKNFFAPAPT